MDRLTATHNARQAGQRARIKAFDARLTRAEELTRQVCGKRGQSHDALTRDIRTADESNHLAALATKYDQTETQIQALNEANAQRCIKGMLQKLLAGM
jgi:hypothetical protein